jgi:hypothetical protein
VDLEVINLECCVAINNRCISFVLSSYRGLREVLQCKFLVITVLSSRLLCKFVLFLFCINKGRNSREGEVKTFEYKSFKKIPINFNGHFVSSLIAVYFSNIS